jgi:hypothetical protein
VHEQQLIMLKMMPLVKDYWPPPPKEKEKYDCSTLKRTMFELTIG